MKGLQHFEKDELSVVNEAVAIAEEMTSNAYKMSPAEWGDVSGGMGTAAAL